MRFFFSNKNEIQLLFGFQQKQGTDRSESTDRRSARQEDVKRRRDDVSPSTATTLRSYNKRQRTGTLLIHMFVYLTVVFV